MACCGFSFSPGPFFSVGLRRCRGASSSSHSSDPFVSLIPSLPPSIDELIDSAAHSLPPVYRALLISRTLLLHLLTLIPISCLFLFFPFPSRLCSQSQTLSAIVPPPSDLFLKSTPHSWLSESESSH